MIKTQELNHIFNRSKFFVIALFIINGALALTYQENKLLGVFLLAVSYKFVLHFFESVSDEGGEMSMQENSVLMFLMGLFSVGFWLEPSLIYYAAHRYSNSILNIF